MNKKGLSEQHTPKSDLWQETVELINNFGENYHHPTGLSVNECLAEHRDLARMVHSGYGADPTETQADRNAEIENCVTQEDLDIILEFYGELTKNVEKLKRLFEKRERHEGDVKS